jgi:hypothetical protein
MMKTDLLPEYPRISHLPHLPNATQDDLITSAPESELVFSADEVYVEEKVDGSQCGWKSMCYGIS